MVLQVKMYGSGTDADPYRVKLPTYVLIHGDIPTMSAIVSVPDSTIGLTPTMAAQETLAPTTSGMQLKTLSPTNAASVQAALNSNYPQAGGTFKVEIV